MEIVVLFAPTYHTQHSTTHLQRWFQCQIEFKLTLSPSLPRVRCCFFQSFKTRKPICAYYQLVDLESIVRFVLSFSLSQFVSVYFSIFTHSRSRCQPLSHSFYSFCLKKEENTLFILALTMKFHVYFVVVQSSHLHKYYRFWV